MKILGGKLFALLCYKEENKEYVTLTFIFGPQYL